jgi:hypothetical protein
VSRVTFVRHAKTPLTDIVPSWFANRAVAPTHRRTGATQSDMHLRGRRRDPMICTTFAQRTGIRPARARVDACRGQVVRPVTVQGPAAVGVRLADGTYPSWQLPADTADTAIASATTHRAAMTVTTFGMSIKCRTRTLGTRPT